MHAPDNTPIPELIHQLENRLQGEVRADPVTRLLYSTDASIYQIEPLAVAFPKDEEDLAAAVEVAAGLRVPILARGAGSSLAGQAVGRSLILDCSRYMNKILEIDPETHQAEVQPGVVLDNLNRAAAQYGLQFGPDPASGERATVGGSLANNATGSHSIRYGMAADHLHSLDVIWADGSTSQLGEIPLHEARRRAGLGDDQSVANLSADARFFRAALELRESYGDRIRTHWPHDWRRASGYNLNYLLPWSPSAPPQWSENAYPPVSPASLNLAALIAGSEGTLAVIRRARLNLVPVPRHTLLAVLAYPGIAEACEAVPALLEASPSAVELIPRTILHKARSVPAYAGQVAWVDDLRIAGEDPEAILVVEFAGDNPTVLRARARALSLDGTLKPALMAETASEQRQVWGVRKVGLGLLMSRYGDVKPWPFMEDLSVPVEELGPFVRELEHILSKNGLQAEFYAHASAGCLHIRPLLNLKTAKGVRVMREVAAEAIALTLRHGGIPSGEHGDGLARSQWLEETFGPDIIQAFRELKQAADPNWLLNPGKVVSRREGERLPQMDENLRFGPDYKAKAWKPVMDFRLETGLDGAIEQCNGAGVCRKEGGVMCPSFQATREEMHSTRGRANLLRAMISGQFPVEGLAEKAVYQALDLCLACKGCKAECPSAVDMAKLKYEFLQRYYQRYPRRWRDYLFAYIDRLARFGHPFALLANPLLHNRLGRWIGQRWLGLAEQRDLPHLARHSFREQFRREQSRIDADRRNPELPGEKLENVLFLVDAFTEFFYPEDGIAAVRLLQRAGCRVQVLPVTGAGRTLISKGFLEAARRHAVEVVDAIWKADPQGSMAVVGIEPSEIYTLRDEYLALLPEDERAASLAQRAWMVDEFLVRPSANTDTNRLRIDNLIAAQVEGDLEDISKRGDPSGKVLLHGHCYQKAQPPSADRFPTGVPATVAMLQAAGFEVEVIDAGCCGMAGAFGYEAEHYPVSMQIGELSLLPTVRQAKPEQIIAASGVSCQAQIADGAQRPAIHPVRLLASLLE